MNKFTLLPPQSLLMCPQFRNLNRIFPNIYRFPKIVLDTPKRRDSNYFSEGYRLLCDDVKPLISFLSQKMNISVGIVLVTRVTRTLVKMDLLGKHCIL